MNLVVSPRSGGQSGRVVEDYRDERIGANNDIGKDVHQYVSCKCQYRQGLEQQDVTLPNVASKMLTPSEAESARRVVGAVKPL